jgi:hypothetical protein
VQQEKDRDGCPKIVNLGATRTDLFYERKKYGFKKRWWWCETSIVIRLMLVMMDVDATETFHLYYPSFIFSRPLACWYTAINRHRIPWDKQLLAPYNMEPSCERSATIWCLVTWKSANKLF